MANNKSKKDIEEQVEVDAVAEDVVEEGVVTIVPVKPKMSLKKLLLIGGGILAGLIILGAGALGTKKSEKPADESIEDSNGDDEVADPAVTDEDDDDKIPTTDDEEAKM